MPSVVLVRHGQTDWNRDRRIQGWAPTSLNDYGREQARAAGRHLGERYAFDRFVASDLRRTRETARHVHATGVEPAPTFLEGWRERSFGDYQGLSYEAVFERHPEYDLQRTGVVALESRPPGGETMHETYDRVLAAWEDLLAAAAPDDDVLVVTHGGPIYVTLGHVKGLDAVTAIGEHHQHNCAINEIDVDADGTATVVRENDTDYPGYVESGEHDATHEGAGDEE